MAEAPGSTGPHESARLRRFAWAVTVSGLALVPWTAYLPLTLPARHTSHFYNVSWAVFDLVLLTGLVGTGVAARRGSRRTGSLAAATAALLFADAWFDVSGSWGTPDLPVAVLLAVLVELPLGVVCWRLSRRPAGAPRRTAGRAAASGRPEPGEHLGGEQVDDLPPAGVLTDR